MTKRRISIKNRKIFIVTMAYLLILTVVFIPLIYQKIRIIEERTDSGYLSMLLNVSNSLEQKVSMIDSINILISGSSEALLDDDVQSIENMTYLERLPYYKIMDLYESMLGGGTQAIVYLKKSGCVLTSKEMSRLSDFMSSGFVLNDYAEDTFISKISGTEKEVIGPVSITKYKVPSEEIVLIRTNPMLDSRMTFLVSINSLQIGQEFGQLDENDGLGYIITDEKGTPFFTDAAGKSFLGKHASFDTSRQIQRAAGYKIFTRKIAGANWAVSLLVPDNRLSVFQNSLFIELILYMLLVLSGLFALWFIVTFFSRRVTGMLGMIGSKAQVKSAGLDVMDRFRELEENIRSILDREKNLNIQIESEKDNLVSMCFQLLMKGELEKREEILRTLAFLGIPPTRSYCVCAVQGEEGSSELLSELLRGTETECVRLAFEFRIVLVIFEPLEKLDGFISCINAGIQNAGSIKIFGGISDSFYDIFDMKPAYEQAKEALKWHIYDEQGRIVRFNDIQGYTQTIAFTDAEEKSLTQAICTGDLSELSDFLNRLRTTLLTEPVCPRSAEAYFLELWHTMNRIGKNTGVDRPFEGKLPLYPVLDDLIRSTLAYADEIRRSSTLNRNRKIIGVSERLLQYVNDNLTDESLSLKSISAAFNISLSLVSKIFAEAAGTNFHEYVQMKRIEYAKKLLLEQNMDIQSVAKKVGFENNITFRRVFKSLVGVAPALYRSTFSKNERR